MIKKQVNAFDYAAQICKALPKGILLTTRQGEKVNAMTIGWGKIGIEWGKPIFVAYVRQSRYTKELLDATGEFTINVPVGAVDKQILGFCGTRSGRDVNKIAALGLELVEPEQISVPGIRQLPLTLECRVIYQQEQDLSAIPGKILAQNYPADEAGNRDGHTAYYGEILDAYLIEP